jgi:hypothetical protein
MTIVFPMSLTESADWHAAMLAVAAAGLVGAATLAHGAAQPPQMPTNAAPGEPASVPPAEAGHPGDAQVLARPVSIKAALQKGGEIQGQIVGWDRTGFDAVVDRANRRIGWDDLTGLEVYRVRKRLHEALPVPERKAAYLELFAYLLSRDDTDRIVDRALEDAKRLGATASDVEVARSNAEAKRQARNEDAARTARARLGAGSPEAAPFSTFAWPKTTAEERARAVLDLKQKVTSFLAAGGRELTPVDAHHVLVYSGLGLDDAAKRATHIEQFIEASLPRIGMDAETTPWRGKLVVIVSDDRDRFRLIEASAFRQQSRDNELAITHYDGADAFVHVAKSTDESSSSVATFRAIALAMLHAHISAGRLPAWAHEGFADWLVASYRPTKSLDQSLRRSGLAQVRGPIGFGRALRCEYGPGEWPFPDEATRGAAYVFTSYLAERHPAEFLSFLTIVKGGEPWQSAFERAFKMPLERMVATAYEYHRVND